MTDGASRKPEPPAGGKAKIDGLHGRVIAGKFQIQELIGVGAMGRVYKAHNSALDKVVAVKVLSVPPGLNDPSHAIRFKAEARAASRIDHENSVQIYDFGTDGADNLMYIAMEYLQGQNLGDVVKRVGKLSMLRASNIMMQVLAVLAVAHRNGVVHRDLKPANIMLIKKRGDDGEVNDFVKVCDFGIAKVMEPGGSDDATAMTMTKAGAVFGTPAYMSPEQARGEKIDFRTDLFSCGVILYRMIAGKTPFSAESAVGLLTKLMTEEPTPLSVVTSTVDKRLEAIVHKAMQKDRSARFQSAADMRSALKEVLGDPAALEAPAAPGMITGRPPASVSSSIPPMMPVAPMPSMRSVSAPGLHVTRPPPQGITPVPASSEAAAPFQTLTASPAFPNRTGTWSGTGTVRPPIIAQEKTSSKKTIAIAAAVLAIAAIGYGIFARQYRRNTVNEMQEMIAVGSYGVAENVFHEHYDEMLENQRAIALIPDLLAKRREIENDEARFGVKWDPGYTLQPSKWEVMFKERDTKSRTQKYYLVIEEANDYSFHGYLDWPDAGIRAGIRGIRHGNHLVFWDHVVLKGNPKNYVINDKKNAYIEGERIVGTDGPYSAQINGTLKKPVE